jgi:hypothetical protein
MDFLLPADMAEAGGVSSNRPVYNRRIAILRLSVSDRKSYIAMAQSYNLRQ